jgi:hypothetical protein
MDACSTCILGVDELVPTEAARAVTGLTPRSLVAGEAASQHLISETLVLWHPGEGHARARRLHARGLERIHSAGHRHA